ncbi:MAG: hypothetical protein NZO58_09235 [Gemmataceae bacterium]|nr:hypothetical protein [Gemmataceae bacterium]
MRTTLRTQPPGDVLRPWSIVWFGLSAALGILLALTPAWDGPAWRGLARWAGYGALFAMLVPYVHIVVRWLRPTRRAMMTRWLRWHIAAAYLALILVLVHSQGRADTPLTWALFWLTWIVIISGVVGYYGQKLLYALLPRLVVREFGLERLEPQRQHLVQAAQALLQKKEMQGAPEVIQSFCTTAVAECLAPPLRMWERFGRTWSPSEPLSINWYERTLSYADAKQQAVLQELWRLVQTRRSLNLEYRWHQLGRLWLLVHGPAAWALLLLMIEHVVSSIWYGGF